MKVYIQRLINHEGFISGAWFYCPLNIELISEKLGIYTDDDYVIAECDLVELREDVTLQEINHLAIIYTLEIEGTELRKN